MITPGPANSALWGTTKYIWNDQNTLSNGFGSAARDTSRPRENGNHMVSPSDPIEGKTGSGSLVASSEFDGWNGTPSPWGDNVPHARRSDVSPARKRSIAQAQTSRQYPDNSSSNCFSVIRPLPLVQPPVGKPSKPLLDPTTTIFKSTQQIEPLTTNNFSNFRFAQADVSQQRSEASPGSWADAASVHSPGDDRRSVEYFGQSSAAPSRSGSLPPSRHGGESLQYTQPAEPFPRYPQFGYRQHASFSHANGRTPQDRSGSIQSDSHATYQRHSLYQYPDQDPGMMSHRQSLSTNGLPPGYNSAAGNDLSSYANGQILTRPEDAAYGNPGTYTPDSYVGSNVSDLNAQFGAFQLASQSVPNGTFARASPHYSHAHTPPVHVHDHLYPSRTDQTLSNGSSIAHLHNKLHGYQQQQQGRPNIIPPNQPQPQQFQQLIASNQMRNQYGYQYPVPNGVNLNQLSNVGLSVIPQAAVPSMVAVMTPPKAPRSLSRQHESSIMSDLLFEFKQASKTSKRYELNDIYGHVVEFSGDQHGSRFIQQKLESANSDQKQHVFEELQTNALQLMTDVFGNYVIQKFFEHGDQIQKRFLANKMKGHVWDLAKQMYGCRVVQKALEHVLTDQQAELVKELNKDVPTLVRDQNGNHVIQKAIERVPLEHIGVILETFKGQVGALSVHSYGCRVIQRVLEFCAEPARRFVLQELHAEGPKLISDVYGNYVMQHVIEFGLPEDRARVLAHVKEQLLAFSKQKFASNVVEKCLVCGSREQQREIMLPIIEKNERGENHLLTLIKDPYGNYVIQKMMDTITRPDYEELLATLEPDMPKAKKNISGKQILQVEKKMHRFDRVDSITSPTTQDASTGSATDNPPTPPLTSEAQSPQSISVPSASTSTVDEPVHTSPSADKDFSTPSAVINIENERIVDI
ncbi:armadillo-type protein [Massariosphaeria phaeospora]|uniref:Pumilio homology domain family member 3 n=1 Tax=Massariosphaeria phaeospora TaxID=100035 RepID=A0A7C8MLD0_9PLEO|nr:armadillo-type protein [Massariosphaeria phaeospora]